MQADLHGDGNQAEKSNGSSYELGFKGAREEQFATPAQLVEVTRLNLCSLTV
jgi:hypothetical protein